MMKNTIIAGLVIIAALLIGRSRIVEIRHNNEVLGLRTAHASEVEKHLEEIDSWQHYANHLKIQTIQLEQRYTKAAAALEKTDAARGAAEVAEAEQASKLNYLRHQVIQRLEDALGHSVLTRLNAADTPESARVQELLQETVEALKAYKEYADMSAKRAPHSSLQQAGMWLVLPASCGEYAGCYRYTDVIAGIQEDHNFPVGRVESVGSGTLPIFYLKKDQSQQCSWDWKIDEACYELVKAAGLARLLL